MYELRTFGALAEMLNLVKLISAYSAKDRISVSGVFAQCGLNFKTGLSGKKESVEFFGKTRQQSGLFLHQGFFGF